MMIQTRVFTSHGTLVYWDDHTRQLRHGKAEVVPMNVNLLRGDARSFVLSSNDKVILQGSILPIDADIVAFQIGDEFLCAEPLGTTRHAPHAKAWEMFFCRNLMWQNGSIVSTKMGQRTVRFFVTNPSDEVQKWHYRGEFYERQELALMVPYIGTNSTVLDIGANVGNHTIYFSKFADPSRIILIEPNQTAIDILRINLAINNCREADTSYLGVALGAVRGRLRSVAYDNNLGGTEFVPDANGPVIAMRGDELFACQPIHFIKIDVEGMEMEILAGLQQTIERFRPPIFIEIRPVHKESFEIWIERNGYVQASTFKRYVETDNFVVVPRS